MNVFLGPRTLSWPTLALLAIVGPIAAVVSDPTAAPRDRLVWLGIGVIAQAVLTLIYIVGARLGGGRSRVAVLAVVSLGAAGRAIAIAAIANIVGPGDPLSGPQRVASATVTFIVWGVLLGAAVQSWADYRETLRALLRRVDRTLADADALSKEWQARLRTTSAFPDELAATALALQADIEKHLRPMSHRLWFGLTDRQARARFITSFMTEPIPLAWIAVISVGLYTWTVSYHFGFVFGLFSALLTVGCIIGVLLLSQALSRALPHYRAAIRVTTFVVAPLVTVPIDIWVIGQGDPLGVAAIMLAILTVIMGTQGVAVGLRLRRSSLYSLSTQVDILDAERSAAAARLHSTMQSRWTAAAMRLQEAAESADPESAQRAIADVRAVFDHTSPHDDTPTDLSTLARAWEGIAAITVHVPPDVPDVTRPTLSLLVEEAISNAIRHGRARTIDVLVTVTATTVDVVIVDDGSGVSADAQPGLGSRWLDGVATWRMTCDDHGSRLSASISCAPGS